MSKPEKRVKNKKAQASKDKSKKTDVPEKHEENGNPYGGIPDRDLKKNLGCG